VLSALSRQPEDVRVAPKTGKSAPIAKLIKRIHDDLAVLERQWGVRRDPAGDIVSQKLSANRASSAANENVAGDANPTDPTVREK
jgi:hypothetical protein